MTNVTWITLFPTPHWAFQMMAMAVIIAIVCILYAITSTVEQSWPQRPSQAGNTREILQRFVSGLSRDLKW